jgi:hypothetical protein
MSKLKSLNLRGTTGAYDSDCLGLDQGCTGLVHNEFDGLSRQVLMPDFELGVHTTLVYLIW